MEYQIFIPSEKLVKTSRWTIHSLALIGAVALIACAGAVALYAIAWLCTVMTVFIHAFAEVCHAIYMAFGGNPLNIVIVCITWLALVFCVKGTCILFSSSMDFRVNGARV